MADPNGNGMANSEATQLHSTFWPRVSEEIRNLQPHDFKQQELPLARIKKIMKLDEEVKMISAEAPVLFSKAAEIFISELSLRSWIHTEDNKRRTLQRNDIAMAIGKCDQFDFLIDIVPRDELKPTKRPDENVQRTSLMPDQVQYYFQLAQQHQAALQQQNVTSATTAVTPTIISQPQPQQPQQQQQPQPQQQPQQQQQQVQIQVLGGSGQQQILQQAQPIQIQGGQIIQQNGNFIQLQGADGTAQPQIIQLQSGAGQQATPQQVIHQVVTNTGEIQNVPIQLTQSQLQAIQSQVQGKQAGQPIIIQSTGGTAQAAAGQDAQQFAQPLFQIQNINGQQVLFQAQGVNLDDQSQTEDVS